MLRERETVMMEDRGWSFDDSGEPAIKFDRGGNEVAREDDAEWEHDLKEVRELL